MAGIAVERRSSEVVESLHDEVKDSESSSRPEESCTTIASPLLLSAGNWLPTASSRILGCSDSRVLSGASTTKLSGGRIKGSSVTEAEALRLSLSVQPCRSKER